MADLSSIFYAMGVLFVLTISPGPAVLATARLSMAEGRHVGFVFANGLTVGHMCWGSISLLGFQLGSGLLGDAQQMMSVFAAVVLFWLALQSLRSALSAGEASQTRRSRGAHFFEGLTLNLVNPIILHIWVTAFSLGHVADVQIGHGWIFVGACLLIIFLSYSIIAFMFSVSGTMEAYQRIRRPVDLGVAALFGYLAIGSLRSVGWS